MDVLTVFCRLADPVKRQETAKTLAALLGADELYLFALDPEIGVLLPPPRFVTLLNDGLSWKKYLQDCKAQGIQSGRLTDSAGVPKPAVGIFEKNAAIVALGQNVSPEALAPLKPFLPLLGSALIGEWMEESARGKIAEASAAALHSDALSKVLQVMRRDLQLSLENQRTYAEKLEMTNKDLEQFAYIASHDLQEPLRKIISFADRLRQLKGGDNSSSEGTESQYLEKIYISGVRMKRVIEDLLQFSRLESQAHSFESMDLNWAIADTLADLEFKITETGADIRTQEMPTVTANRSLMRHLFQNLILNSIKFSKKNEKPLIEISAKELEFAMEISVRDNGIGFDEKYSDRIFKPFQRLHGKHEYEGSGIGLSICQKIAALHGGSIRAESRPDQGARFIVTLPKR